MQLVEHGLTPAGGDALGHDGHGAADRVAALRMASMRWIMRSAVSGCGQRTGVASTMSWG